MGIKWVREHWEGRQGKVDGKGIQTFRRNFHVRTNLARTGQIEVSNAVDPVTGLSIPKIWSTYVTPTEAFNLAVCVGVDPQQKDDPFDWKVLCDYTTDTQELFKGSVFNRLPKVAWSTEEIKEGLETDWDGKAILNSAGDPFDTQESPRGIDVMKVERNIPIYNRLQHNQFRFSLNDRPWYGFDAGTVLYSNYGATQEFEKNSQGQEVYFWRLMQEMKVDKKGWELRLLDRGFRAFGPVNQFGDRPRAIITCPVTGHPLTREALLDGFGFVLAGPPFVPAYMVFRRFPDRDLNLVLPESILPPYQAGPPGP